MNETKRSWVGALVIGVALVSAATAAASSSMAPGGFPRWQDPSQSEDPVLLQRLGILYIQENQPQEAIRALLRATDLMPENGETHMWLGFAYYLNGQLDEAEESYYRALSHNPSLTEVRNYLGLLWFKRGEPERAVGEFEEAIADPLYPAQSKLRVYINLARVYIEETQPELALDALQSAVQLATDRTDQSYQLTYLLLGTTLRQLGRTDEAVSALEEVLQLDDRNIEANLVIGLAYRDRGEPLDACRHLQQVLRLAPGSESSERAQAALAQLPC